LRDVGKSPLILIPVLALVAALFWYQRAQQHRVETQQSDAAWMARLESAKQYVRAVVSDGDMRARTITAADRAHVIVRSETVKGCISPETWPPPEEPDYREQLFTTMGKLARSEGRADDAAQFKGLADRTAAEHPKSTGLAGLDEFKREMGALRLTTQPATQESAGPK
jgi:hypothetical protein